MFGGGKGSSKVSFENKEKSRSSVFTHQKTNQKKIDTLSTMRHTCVFLLAGIVYSLDIGGIVSVLQLKR